jgi:hypothetical protein
VGRRRAQKATDIVSHEAGHTKRMSMIVSKGTFDSACPPSSWPPPLRHVGMPNIVAAVPGVDAAAIAMMKILIGSKGVPSIPRAPRHCNRER